MMARTDDAAGPIFVVGPSRSGTGLMRTCLNQHSGISLAARETHYFDDLRQKLARREGLPLASAEQRRCENYFLTLAYRPYGQGGDPDASPMSREELREAAAKAGGGPDGYFEAFCRLQADAYDGIRWGEKTPRHVFGIGDILSAYPAAQVICMVRDPRAVVASARDAALKDPGRLDEADPERRADLEREQRRKSQSYDVLVASLLWRSGVKAGAEARGRFGAERVRVQRYEDLVIDPERALQDLAGWLGVDFESSMLDVPRRNSSYEVSDERGMSAEPLARWRTVLSAEEVRVIESACRGAMREHCYERVRSGGSIGGVAAAWISLPFKLYRAAVANRSRSGKSLVRYVLRRLRAAIR